MDGWGRGDDSAVAETSMANASRQPAISGKPDHSDRGSLTMVAPVLLLLPPLLCVLLLVAAPSSALPPPPSCCSLLCSAYVLQGVVLATGVGALRSKVAERWYLLYKMDKQGANLMFIYWWEDKVSAMLLSSGSEWSDGQYNFCGGPDGGGDVQVPQEARCHPFQLCCSCGRLCFCLGYKLPR
ncbi:uncharacterized protein [Triticum aestivum]|uniref:uncharacterized protein isoform X2 n=1 Tax=Triticum aestivum TaxID=4565 RepID=UPI001D02BE17|nr:uncharacterized protein LOC123104251 isoform X2 [Triticum aestivum]